MIKIQADFPAHALKRNVTIQALIPVDSEMDWKNTSINLHKRFKTLYLLHGFGGDCNDWLLNTRLYQYASTHNIAIIMPSGENSFYVDLEYEEEYYSGFICKELIEITRAVFPLSERREDTAIGGLSMGGYGALRNAFLRPDVFGSVIALSSALIMKNVETMQEGYSDFMAGYGYYRNIFGNPKDVMNSDKNPLHLAARQKQSGQTLPQVYLACGKSDFVLGFNRDFASGLKKLKIPFTYEEDTGNHDWNFWDKYIQKALDWLEQEHKC